MVSVNNELTVGQVAKEYGVTVRTLHHYDAIGLVSPSGRSTSGYRLYDESDLARLAQVVAYRRLELGLDEIATLLADGDVAGQLRQQRDVIQERITELTRLLAAVDNELEHVMNDKPIDNKDLKEVFGDAWDESYDTEAEQRWGDTKEWAQSQQRRKSWTRVDIEAMKDEHAAVTKDLAAVMAAGDPASPAARAVAERHRAWIGHFYDCSYEMHRNLAQLYVTDPRFTATYEGVRPGLAQFLHDAINANADAQEGTAVGDN